MAVTDAPTVTIDGVTLASTWSLTQRIALSGLAITWGRERHTDQTVPATLTLEVLDTDGQLRGSAVLAGRRVSVVRADGRTIFRGRIDDFDIDHVVLRDPDTQLERRVWRHKIIASDVLAELARTNLPGPGTPANPTPGVKYPPLEDFGADYWPSEYGVYGRLQKVLAAGAADIIAGIEWENPYPEDSDQPYLNARPRADLSVLDHIESAYKAGPLWYAHYNPDTNWIYIGEPATTNGVELTWDGDTLDIDLLDGAVIPARIVVVPNGYTAKNDAQTDLVQVATPMRAPLNPSPAESIVTRPTAHYSQAATGRNELRIENAVASSLSDVTVRRFEWPFPIEGAGDEFGWRDDTNSFHYGIDFPQPQGTPIKSAGAGTVIVSEYHSGWGNHVRVDHGDDLITLYAHMVNPGVPVGTVVQIGTVLGNVGNTGNSFGAHLHFETRVGGSNPINPREFMDTYGNDNSGNPEVIDAWQRGLANDTVALLDQINGRVRLPVVRFDWRYFDYGQDVAAGLIYAMTWDAAIYFPGSVFATVYDAATEHQVIGGRLVYHRGWTLDATLAPAIRTRDGITVAQLVTIDPPLISDYADHLLIADLGAVTKGVTA